MTSCRRLEGRVALVTGGASGIGAAVVRQFVREGAKVAFTDLVADRAAELVEELGEAVTFIQGDHTVDADNARAVEAAVAAFGGLDILHANAGIIIGGDIETTETHRIEHLLRVNLLGPFQIVKAALPALRNRAAQRQCAILFSASIQSLMVRPGYTAYGASKHGLAGLAASLALELAGSNIRVNALCPGPVDTPLFRAGTRQLAVDAAAVDQSYKKSIPLGRLIEASEVAQAAAFLVSDQASAITGVLLPVDGGITAR